MDWQQPVVFLIGALAVLYLVRRNFAGRKSSSCGGCNGCGTAAKPSAPERQSELVQIEGLAPRK
jgi:hypothetical protein